MTLYSAAMPLYCAVMANNQISVSFKLFKPLIIINFAWNRNKE